MLKYRYDTQLLIDGDDLDEQAINDYIRDNIPGDSLLAVGDDMLIKIHIATIQQTLNTMNHTVYLSSATILSRLENAYQTRIDNRGRTTGLSNNHITYHIKSSSCAFRRQNDKMPAYYYAIIITHLVWKSKEKFLF